MRSPPLTVLRAGPPFRALRTAARPAIRWGLALSLGLGAVLTGTTGVADAASTTPSPPTAPPGTSVSDLQIQAQELAGQIAANGRSLDELSASYEAAQIQYQKLSTQQAALRQQMVVAEAAVAAARQALKDQALLAYLAGGAPIINYVPGHPGLDPSLTVSYAEIVAGGQKDAVEAYRATLDAQARQKAALDSTTNQVQVTLRTIRSDQAQANATLAAQQQALSQVKGQLAVAVAQVEAQQQAAAQAREQAALAASVVPPKPATTTTTTTAPSETTTTSTRRTTDTTPASAANSTTTIALATATSATTTNPGGPTNSPTPTTTTPNNQPTGPPPPQAPDASAALAYARAQLGKPYQWGGAGPDSFDCSGLTMMAWEQAGIDFPHLAQDQYNLTAREPLNDLIPGDLVFFGTPDNVYHVGIYIGNGNMIDAPETGQNVSVSSIFWSNLLGAGRVTGNS